MKRLILLLALVPAVCFAEQDALNRFFERTRQKTLEADFTVTMEEGTSQPMTYNGEIKMRGEEFWVRVMGIEAAWDGKTLYTYNEDSNELTLSKPTAEELTEANPLLFAKELANSCKIETREQEDTYRITLTPNDGRTSVKSFILTLRKTDLMPLKAVMKESISAQTTLTLKNTRYTDNKASFRVERTGAYINDLR